MPAYKHEHFAAALASVLAQTHRNLEVLVGDNAGDGRIERLVHEAGDPRVRVVPNHMVSGAGARLNHLILWQRASARHVRYVYDDDLIDPRSTTVLLEMLHQPQRCVMAWHQRRVIDAHGNLRQRHGVLAEDQRVLLDRRLLLQNMARWLNFVGEPSFLMLDRDAISHFDFNRYARIDLAFLWDIAMLLEASRDGLLAGSGEFLGSFRLHEGQVSSSANLYGALEWELVFREELAAEAIDDATFAEAAPRLLGLYQHAKPGLPALEMFQARLLQDTKHGRVREGLPLLRAEYLALRRSLDNARAAQRAAA